MFGTFFVSFLKNEGYEPLVKSLGSTLEEWLCNLNNMHKKIFVGMPDVIPPNFWYVEVFLSLCFGLFFDYSTKRCTKDDTVHNALILKYWSSRGGLLAPIVVGIVRETATKYFDITVDMERIALQGDENGSKHTVWRITTSSGVVLTSELAPEERRRKREDSFSHVMASPLASFESKMFGGVCPVFKSLPSQPPGKHSEAIMVTPPRVPNIHAIKRPTPKRPPSLDTSSYDMRWADPGAQYGLSAQQLCEVVFPLHFGLNKELKVVQCGDELSQTIGFNPLGEHVSLIAMNRSAGTQL